MTDLAIRIANMVINDIRPRANKANVKLSVASLTPAHVAVLACGEQDGLIDRRQSREIMSWFMEKVL